MRKRQNPFQLGVLGPGDPFCNREGELKTLMDHAQAPANVVLYSPRRFGKTSLVKRVQEKLVRKSAVTIFVDFFGVSSVTDIAARLARAVFTETERKKNLFERALRTLKGFRPAVVIEPDPHKGASMSVQLTQEGKPGIRLLEEVMENLGTFIAETDELVHIVLDEFQEITRLEEAPQVEGIMRTHIQNHRAAYCFVGSRRRLLLAMFNDRQRPFFQSAITFELRVLPREEFAGFVRSLFEDFGKGCPEKVSLALVDAVGCYPYYVQKLAHFVYDLAGTAVTAAVLDKAVERLLEDQRPYWEGMILGIPPKQLALLATLAAEPTAQLFAAEYMRRHRLGSIGAIQTAVKKLVSLDLIERDSDEAWHVVDPVFAAWLRAQRAV